MLGLGRCLTLKVFRDFKVSASVALGPEKFSFGPSINVDWPIASLGALRQP